MIGSERNLARPDQVDGDFADAVGRIDRELVVRLHIAADGDDETVHHVFDAIGLLVDRLRDALQERLDRFSHNFLVCSVPSFLSSATMSVAVIYFLHLGLPIPAFPERVNEKTPSRWGRNLEGA